MKPSYINVKKKLVDRASLRTMSAHILTYVFVIFLQNPRLVKKTDHCIKVMIHLVITQKYLKYVIQTVTTARNTLKQILIKYNQSYYGNTF